MLAKAKAKYLRISPRKTRLVAKQLKGKTVAESIYILENLNIKSYLYIKKVINSAFANLNFNRQEKLLEKEIIISSIRIDGGPLLKRYRAATMGRATPIKHRTSHIYVELDKKQEEEKIEENVVSSEK